MSFWVRAMVAAKMAVSAPTRPTTWAATPESVNIGFIRATMYTPAVTMVAAWMRAMTGEGPSMASGSQTYRGSWALLPTAPAKRHKAMTVSNRGCWGAKAGAWAKTAAKLTVLKLRKMTRMPTAKAQSPM